MSRHSVFSVTFRYALISLLEIAAATEGLQAGVIASRHNLSGRYLSNVLSDLKRLGLVTSQKGRKGGYQLARPAHDINLLLLYQGLAGAGAEGSGEQGPDGTESCRADQWLRAVERRWREELGNTNLADVDRSLNLEPSPSSEDGLRQAQ